MATTAAAAAAKRHRVRRRLACGQVEHRADQLSRRPVIGDRANGVVGADPADLVRIHPGQEGGQARQAGQLVPAVPAGHQVGVDQSALGGIDGAEHVHAKRRPGLSAVPCLGHGASPRSCSASLSAFNA